MNCEKIIVGMPKDSVRGPLLFSGHINDLQYNKISKVLNYADNTLLYTCVKIKQNIYV